MKNLRRRVLPSLRLIEYAVALNHHGSFKRASEATGVTQPTFSRGIAALEREYKAQLFVRSSRPVEPTPQGRAFLSVATTLLNDAVRLHDALGEFRNLRSGRVVVGVGPYPLDLSVIETVARLASRYPLLEIEIVEGPWREFGAKLLSGSVEVAVIEASIISGDPRFQVEMLPQHKGCFYCRKDHPLAGRSHVSLTEILEYPLVGLRLPVRAFSAGAQVREQLRLDPITGDVVPRIETTSVAAARGIVKRMNGIGIAAPIQIAEDVQNGSLVLLDADTSTLRSGYGVAHLKDKLPSPGVRTFVETLKEIEAELAAAD